MSKQRLLTDTCSLLRLLANGPSLFKQGMLRKGDLVIHPIVWQEVKRFAPEKKKKYEQELAILHKELTVAQASPVPEKQLKPYMSVIDITGGELANSLSRADKLQLCLALHESDITVVTNDKAYQDLTESFDKVVLNAEDILLEAMSDGVIKKQEAQFIIDKWLLNGEQIKLKHKERLKRRGLKVKQRR